MKPDVKNQLNMDSKPTLNEIVTAIMGKSGHQVTVNQQIRHIFQWILDLALYLTRIAPQTRLNQSVDGSCYQKGSGTLYGSGLLGHLAFMNEMRRAIVYMKLLFTAATSQLNATASGNSTTVNFFLVNSLPVLPLRSSMQKDLLSDLFNIYTKIIYKSIEG